MAFIQIFKADKKKTKKNKKYVEIKKETETYPLTKYDVWRGRNAHFLCFLKDTKKGENRKIIFPAITYSPFLSFVYVLYLCRLFRNALQYR